MAKKSSLDRPITSKKEKTSKIISAQLKRPFGKSLTGILSSTKSFFPVIISLFQLFVQKIKLLVSYFLIGWNELVRLSKVQLSKNNISKEILRDGLRTNLQKQKIRLKNFYPYIEQGQKRLQYNSASLLHSIRSSASQLRRNSSNFFDKNWGGFSGFGTRLLPKKEKGKLRVSNLTNFSITVNKKSKGKKLNKKTLASSSSPLPQSLTIGYFLLLFLEMVGSISYLIPYVLLKSIYRLSLRIWKGFQSQFIEFLENTKLLLVILFRALNKILLTPIPLPSIHALTIPSFKQTSNREKAKKKKKVVKRKRDSLSYQFKKHHILRRFLVNRYSFSLAMLGLFVIFFFYSFMLVTTAQNLPSPEKLSETNGPLTTEIYDRNGILLYRLYEGKNRTLIKLDQVPDYLVKATVAIEDKHFYTHPGVDFEGVARAAWGFAQEREIKGGGSTITQQLIKNTLLTPEQTLKRKVKEVILAFWAERLFTKQEILQMYFNEVPYGGPAWGIVAAAQTYFNKEPQQLDLAEAAYLAGLPASPTTYSPYGSNPEMAKQRQLQVLRRMVEDGYITQDQADLAGKEELQINPPIAQIKAPHFVMYVRSLLSQKYGERMVSQGGLKVTTTLDLHLQEMAEQEVATEVAKLAPLNVSNGAAMITEAKTGQILAMVGSRDYFDPNGGNFNVAIARRQPGSSIKPITYATGFKQGFTPGNLLLDTPISFRNAWEVYAPVNYDGRFHGPVTIRTALGSSYNIPAVKMLSMVGIPDMLSTAKDMGITTFDQPDRYGLSLTLGGGEVKLVDMMSAYGTFSQGGIHYNSEAILKVLDVQNKVLEDNSHPEGKRVLSPEVAYMISDILADNKARTPAFGPNSLLNIPGHIVAVKTGTTDNKRDNWTFGYTPEYVVGVWVGNNNNMPMNPQLTSGITGAAPIWHGIMDNVVRDRPNLAFDRPPSIAEGIVDGKKDLIVSGQKSKSVLGFRNQPDPTGKNQNITFTDPFSSFTLDPNNPSQKQGGVAQ